MIRRWGVGLIVSGALTLGLWFGVGMVLAQEGDGPEVVLSGLNNPQGVLVAPDGSVWAIDAGFGGEDVLETVDPVTGEVSESAFGVTARVVRATEDGGQEDVAFLPSLVFGDEFVGGARLALLDGELYATNGMWTAFEDNRPAAVPGMASIMRIEDGEAVEVANLSGIERRMNPDGTVYESHPYGLAAGPDGKLWVADAGANTLLRVDPSGLSVELISVFPAIPGVFPNPTRGGQMLADPVPTGITFDADGTAYVSYLSGAPFVPGSAKVVRIQANGRPADYATGLTMLTDLRTAPNGEMFAVQFAVFGEQGPALNSGAIVRVLPGEDSEVVLDGLSFPTSIDFNAEGDAYIAINGVGPPGSGSVIRVAGLMAAPAVEPAAVEEAAEEADPTATPVAEEEAEEEEAEPTATPVAEEEAEEEDVEPTATPVAEEEADEEEAEPTATPVAEEEAEEEEAEPTATPVAEEEAEEEEAEPTATPVAEEEAEEEEAEPTATPVAEEEAEEEEAEPTATPVAEEEAEEEEAEEAPTELPATGGSGTSPLLVFGLVGLVLAALSLQSLLARRSGASRTA